MATRRFQVTILDLLLIVVLAACLVTATRDAPAPAIMALLCAHFLLSIGFLTLSILGIVFRRGQAQVFWAGFCAFGWPLFLTFFGFLFVSGFRGPGDGSFFLGIFLSILPFAFLGGTIAKRFVELERPVVVPEEE